MQSGNCQVFSALSDKNGKIKILVAMVEQLHGNPLTREPVQLHLEVLGFVETFPHDVIRGGDIQAVVSDSEDHAGTRERAGAELATQHDNQLLRFRFLGEGHSIGRQKQGAKHHGGTGGQLSKWIHIPTLNQRKAAKTRPKM